MRLYRVLLHLYPASFRHEYGSEMESVFSTRRGFATGPIAVMSLWLAVLIETVGNAALVHWDILRQDLRFIGRSISRTPGFAITAVLVTALGVGANAAAFSVTDYALIRPLPFPEPDRLVKLWQHPPGYAQMELSPANYRDWKAATTSFEDLGTFVSFAANLVGGDDSERIEGARVSGEVFSVLGVDPALGRGFTEDETRPGGPAAVVLSNGLWRSRFAGDPSILGRTINLDDTAYEVVGVMPGTFQFPSPVSRLWVPLRLSEASYEDRADNYLEVIARLRPGATIASARADLDVIARRLADLYPAANRETGATVNTLRDELSDRSRLLLIALAGASVCILIIACANLGSLLLARGLAREREIAVRTALGAGRERLLRQLATESLLLAGVGGLVGITVAVAGAPLLASLIPDRLPMAGGPTIDSRVLAFAAAMMVFTCLVFAVAPARNAGSGLGLDALRGGSRVAGGRKERMRAILVAVEVAASVVLLVAAGLLMRAIERVQDVDPGFQTEGILTLRTALPSPRYDLVSSRERFFTSVLSEVRTLPGVTDAAYVTAVPLVWGGGIWPVVVRGEAEIRSGSNTASIRFVTPGSFSTLGIPIRAGRDVRDGDRQDAGFVAVVSESFAARYWPGQDPIGRSFRTAFRDRQVVGVVGDIRLRGLERAAEPQVYLPAPQVSDSALDSYWPKDLVIKSTSVAGALIPSIRRIIRAADADQPISNVRTIADLVGDQTASRLVQMRILAVLAAIALVLAAVGLHGLLSYTVSQRSREIGVRMALGARAPTVVGLVLKRGLLLALAGIVPGVLLALVAARGMQAALFGVPPADPLTFGVVVSLCLLTAVGGCLMPALRAVRLDPIRALKAD